MPAPLYLLDTNIASFIVRGANPALTTRIQAVPLSQLAVSAVTEGELRYGLARKPEATALAQRVEGFLRHVSVLPWDAPAAQRYGDLRATLESRGTPLASLDTLIAAHALALGATLVTNDRAFFGRMEGLVCEDWTV
jgi:tRNA(fMet)-specific endonuclease VapC